MNIPKNSTWTHHFLEAVFAATITMTLRQLNIKVDAPWYIFLLAVFALITLSSLISSHSPETQPGNKPSSSLPPFRLLTISSVLRSMYIVPRCTIGAMLGGAIGSLLYVSLVDVGFPVMLARGFLGFLFVDICLALLVRACPECRLSDDRKYLYSVVGAILFSLTASFIGGSPLYWSVFIIIVSALMGVTNGILWSVDPAPFFYTPDISYFVKSIFSKTENNSLPSN